jgi:hypothetical protein
MVIYTSMQQRLDITISLSRSLALFLVAVSDITVMTDLWWNGQQSLMALLLLCQFHIDLLAQIAGQLLVVRSNITGNEMHQHFHHLSTVKVLNRLGDPQLQGITNTNVYGLTLNDRELCWCLVAFDQFLQQYSRRGEGAVGIDKGLEELRICRHKPNNSASV